MRHLRFTIWLVIVCTQAVIGQDTPVFDLQGHRGARGLLPENSIPGFIRALDLGVTTLEMDVVISFDKQIVVSHEPWVNLDICDSPLIEGQEIGEKQLNIYEMTYSQVVAFDCGSKGNARFPEQVPGPVTKPKLSDVIVAVEDHIRNTSKYAVDYNIEIKSTDQTDDMYHPLPEKFAEMVYELIDQYLPWKRVVIQSFDVRVLQYLHRIYPHVRLALLVENKKGLVANLSKLGFNPNIYSPNHELLRRSDVQYAHKRGIRVIPWTVNENRDMLALKGMGVDGIITDYPDRAQKFRMTLAIPYKPE